MVLTHVPNEVGNRVIFAGTEDIPGTAVTPDFRLTGTYTATEDAPLNTTPEATGGYDQSLTARRQASTFSGTYGNNLSYEELAILAQYFVKAGAAGVTDGNTVPGFDYLKAPTFNRDDIATMTVQHFVDGLGMQNTGVRFNEVTIGADIDSTEGAWTFSGGLNLSSHNNIPGDEYGVWSSATATTGTVTGAAWTVDEFEGAFIFFDDGSHVGQVREVQSNTADTITWAGDVTPVPAAGESFRIAGEFPAGIATPQYDSIEDVGTLLYLANDFDDLATAVPVTGRLVSWNVTQSLNLSAKRFMDTPRGQVSARVGRGRREVTGQVRFEFDRLDEWFEWRNTKQLSMKFFQEGPPIDETAGTNKEAEIIIPRAYWDTYTPDERGSNLTATFAFRAYLHPTEPIWSVRSKIALPTLP